MGKLDGRVVLITGGARGQGAAEARLLASEGARVLVTDVLDEEGETVAKEIGGIYRHHDVADEHSWAAIESVIAAELGQLDALVNNAGIFVRGTIADMPLEVYRRVVDINQIGTFLGLKTAARLMTPRGSGSVVNISSTGGFQGAPGMIAYNATKFAVRGMTRVAARELARWNIRVNSVAPGPIETELLVEVYGGMPDDKMVRRRVPLGRVGQPEEIAKLVMFLVSDDSSFSTGAEFIADGGVLA